MKKTFTLKPLALSLAVASAATVAAVPTVAQAGLSANVGVFTDYIFRGFNQSEDNMNPALQGGLDYEFGDTGLFAGVWASTMDKEIEYDLYAGWGGSFSGVDLGAAYTAYFYTDEDTYGDGPAFEEINLSAGYGMLSLGVDVDVDGDNDDYVHYSISADLSDYADGMSLTYGSTETDGVDKDSEYVDIGYATTIDKGIDFGLNVIFSGKNTDNSTYIVAGFSKSFDLM